MGAGGSLKCRNVGGNYVSTKKKKIPLHSKAALQAIRGEILGMCYLRF